MTTPSAGSLNTDFDLMTAVAAKIDTRNDEITHGIEYELTLRLERASDLSERAKRGERRSPARDRSCPADRG